MIEKIKNSNFVSIMKQLDPNFHLLLIVFFLTLAISGIYYHQFAIPKATAKATEELRMTLDVSAMPKQTVAVVKKDKTIAKFSQLTPRLIKDKIELKEIPTPYMVDGAITDATLLTNRFAREDLSAGQQITNRSLADQTTLFGHYDRLKEFAITNLVADRVTKGSIVDLLVNYGDGDYDVVLSKKRVVDLVINPEITDPSKTKYTAVFEVNELEYRDLQLAQKIGIFEVRLYLDTDQLQSPKTFDYNRASGRARIQPNVAVSSTPQEAKEVNTEASSESTPIQMAN